MVGWAGEDNATVFVKEHEKVEYDRETLTISVQRPNRSPKRASKHQHCTTREHQADCRDC